MFLARYYVLFILSSSETAPKRRQRLVSESSGSLTDEADRVAFW